MNTTIKLDNLLINNNRYTYDGLAEYLTTLRKQVNGIEAVAFEDFTDYVLKLKTLADEVATIKRKENK